MSKKMIIINGRSYIEFVADNNLIKRSRPLSVEVNNAQYFGMKESGFVGDFAPTDQRSRRRSNFFKRMSDFNKADLPTVLTIRTRNEAKKYETVVILKGYELKDNRVGITIDGVVKSSDNTGSLKFKEEVEKLSPKIRKIFDRIGIKSFQDAVDFSVKQFESVVGVGSKTTEEFKAFRDDVCMKECGGAK